MNKDVLLIPGIVLIMFGAWYFGVGRSTAESQRHLNNSLRAEEQKIAAYQKALARFHDHINTFREQNSREHGRPIMPLSAEGEIIALYTALDSLCHEPGYELVEITPSLEETIKFLREWDRADSSFSMPIRIRLDAGYKPLALLVQAIEAHRNFDRINSCRLYGSDRLYPDCALDLTFTARLGNRMELFDFE